MLHFEFGVATGASCVSGAGRSFVPVDVHPESVVRLLPASRAAIGSKCGEVRDWRVDGYREWLRCVCAPATGCSVAMTAAYAVKLAASVGLRLIRADNRSGFKDVVYRGNVYRAQVKHKDGYHKLGCFPTPEEAALCVSWWRRSSADKSVADTVGAIPTVFVSPVGSGQLPFAFNLPRVMSEDVVSSHAGIIQDVAVDDEDVARRWVDDVLTRLTDVEAGY